MVSAMTAEASVKFTGRDSGTTFNADPTLIRCVVYTETQGNMRSRTDTNAIIDTMTDASCQRAPPLLFLHGP